jgi:hypothetical protein
MFVKISTALFVFGSFNSKSFNHNISLSFAFSVSNPYNAKFLAFLFIDFVKFLSLLGPKATHQPTLIGDLLSQTLAFQVPFCLYSFLPLPDTSHLFFV